MKFSLLIASILSIFLSTNQAHATGCMWYKDYALGPKIENQQNVEGTFTCSEYFCTFEDATSHVKFRIGELDYLPSNLFPPTNQSMSFPVEAFEAMQWSNCDGSDPVPPYERNGTMTRFKFNDHYFIAFAAHAP